MTNFARDWYGIMIMPLGLMMFLNMIFSFAIGKDKSADQFLLGVFLMYLSWVVTYFVFIYPELNKEPQVGGKKR